MQGGGDVTMHQHLRHLDLGAEDPLSDGWLGAGSNKSWHKERSLSVSLPARARRGDLGGFERESARSPRGVMGFIEAPIGVPPPGRSRTCECLDLDWGTDCDGD